MAKSGLRQVWILGVGELAEVHLVEQRQLERALVIGEGFDLRGPKRCQPAQPAKFSERLDASRGDHPPVADHDEMGEPEALAHDLHDLAERDGVGCVAGKDPDRDRTALWVCQEPVLDLGLSSLFVA